MSWLSAPLQTVGLVPGHTAAQTAADEEATQRARDSINAAAAAAEAKKKSDELAALRASVPGLEHTSAANYLTNIGADPKQYDALIDQMINDTLSSVPTTDPNPASYFTDFGQNVADRALLNKRAQATGQVTGTFQPNYASRRVTSDITDPFVNSEFTSQRADADAIIDNLFKRGVITNTGKQSATNALDLQNATVRGKLRTAADNTLAGGQQSLDDVINKAMQTAGTINLNQNFDVGGFQSDADKAFNNFLSTAGDRFKAQVPGKLFDTSGLAAIAGAGQGAQNTKFNPLAAAGVIQDDTTNPDESKNKSTQSVF